MNGAEQKSLAGVFEGIISSPKIYWYFIPVCTSNKFSSSKQIHPVGANESLAVSFFILDILVIIRVLFKIKSIRVFGVSIYLH